MMIMNPHLVSPIVAPLLAIQFAAFGWRINREIPLGDQGRKTWFPLPDVVNILSMLCVVVFAIVFPLANDPFPRLAWVVIGVAYELIAFHPVTMAAHYRLCSKEGRAVYLQKGNKHYRSDQDFPYATGQEIASLLASLVGAIITASFLCHRV
jgi:hypothetical protein